MAGSVGMCSVRNDRLTRPVSTLPCPAGVSVNCADVCRARPGTH